MCFVLFPLFGPGTSHAAKAELSESVLAKISVEGLKRVQEDAALRGVRLKLGDVVSRESTRMLLGDVWDTGFFKSRSKDLAG